MKTQLYADGRLELHTEREHTEHNAYVFSAEDVAELRRLLSIPGLTDEERAVVEAERVLKEEVESGTITGAFWCMGLMGHYYKVFLSNSEQNDWNTVQATTRAAAATAAAQYVASLAKKKALPEPEDRTADECGLALRDLGWVLNGEYTRDDSPYPMWAHDGITVVMDSGDETLEAFYRRALTRALEARHS